MKTAQLVMRVRVFALSIAMILGGALTVSPVMAASVTFNFTGAVSDIGTQLSGGPFSLNQPVTGEPAGSHWGRNAPALIRSTGSNTTASTPPNDAFPDRSTKFTSVSEGGSTRGVRRAIHMPYIIPPAMAEGIETSAPKIVARPRSAPSRCAAAAGPG